MPAGREVQEIDRRMARLERMRRSTLYAARVHDAQAGLYGAMVTLTYARGIAWGPRHISDCLALMRKYCQRRGFRFRYAWVMELTRAKVPHYHICLWLPHGEKLPMPDRQGWWVHGMTRIERARHAVGYIAKYASKGGCLDGTPRGARICGAGGFDEEERKQRSWAFKPAYVRETWDADARPTRAKGGGFVNRATGEILRSPWCVVAIGKYTIRLALRGAVALGRVLGAAPPDVDLAEPSSWRAFSSGDSYGGIPVGGWWGAGARDGHSSVDLGGLTGQFA